MFHPALWKLIRLQWRGAFRQLKGSLKSVRGLFFLGFVIAMSLYGMASLYFASRVTSHSPQFAGFFDQLQDDFLPVIFLLITTYVILFSTGEATVFFTASEAAFLFPAPITRKQLLSYTLLKSILGMIFVSLFFVMFSTPSIAMALPRWVAISLTLLFLQLLTMNVAFIRNLMQDKMHVFVRQLIGLAIGGALLFALAQTIQSVEGTDLTAYWKAFKASTTAPWLLAPFQVFARALRAPDWISFLPYAAILLIVDVLLLQLAYRLDALSLEAALATSEKLTARIKLMQTKGVWHAFGSNTSAVAQRRVPQLPFWAGVGPILWQRLTTTFRSSAKLLYIVGGALVFAAGLVYFIGSKDSDASGIVAPVVGLVAMGYVSFLICLVLQNDIERIAYLKSLPIRSMAIVLGDLVGFPVLLSIVQSLFIIGEACFFSKVAPWLLFGALLVLPFNLLLFGIDKLVFYIYPTRMAKGAPGDFQNAGKQMIFMALKMLMLGAAALIVVLAALPGAMALQSPLVAAASAGIVLAIECAVLLPLLKLAYDRFDPSIAVVN